MNRPDIAAVIDKARRLRALKHGAATAGEAQAAARALAKLLDKYRLDTADLDEHEEFETSDAALLVQSRIAIWKNNLMCVLARHYGVALFERRTRYVQRSKGRKRRRAQSAYMMHGVRQDMDCMRYMFAWLSADVMRLGRLVHREHGAHCAHSWRLGFVHGLDEQLAAARNEAASESKSRSLVHLNNRHLRAIEHFEARNKLSPSRRRQSAADIEAYRDGYERGINHHLGDHLKEAKPCKENASPILSGASATPRR